MFVCISIRVETAIELYAHAGKISVSGVMSCSGVCRPSPVVDLHSLDSMLVYELTCKGSDYLQIEDSLGSILSACTYPAC